MKNGKTEVRPAELLARAEADMDGLLGMDALADAGDVLAREEWLDARAERVEAPGDNGKVRLVRRVTASSLCSSAFGLI